MMNEELRKPGSLFDIDPKNADLWKSKIYTVTKIDWGKILDDLKEKLSEVPKPHYWVVSRHEYADLCKRMNELVTKSDSK